MSQSLYSREYEIRRKRYEKPGDEAAPFVAAAPPAVEPAEGEEPPAPPEEPPTGWDPVIVPVRQREF